MRFFFTSLLAVACFAVLATSAPVSHQQLQYDDSSLQDPNTPKRNCHKLCESCGCRGYYCGDECICQCNWADQSNVRCIQNMRSRSQKEAYPFEVLIQGPAGRRFVREATDIAPEDMETYKENERSGRSVYSIYKPKQIGKGQLMAVADSGSDGGAGSGIRFPKLAGLFKKPSDQVSAPAPADPTVGAPAPAPTAPAADPTVGAAAPAPPPPADPAPAPAADPTVGSPAAPPTPDPTVGSPVTADSIVGNIRNLVSPGGISSSWINWPRINVDQSWSQDLLKRINRPLSSPAIILQPLSTL